MPNSLKCKIKHLYHNGTITKRERDRILEALDQQSELFKIGLLKDCESCTKDFRRYLDSREQEPRCQEVHAISIPNNATNGDMFMVMFTRAIKSNYIESDLSMKDYVTIYLSDYEMRVSYDWWNAPYKAESEDMDADSN